MLFLAAVTAMTVTGCLLFVPQLVRVYRTGSVAGLSASSLLNGSVSFAAWSVYLGVRGEVLLTVATVVPALVWWWLAAVAVPRLRPTRAAWLSVAVWAGIVVSAALAGGVGVVGAVLAVSVVWAYLPAAMEAWRSPDISGVSAATWLLCAAEAAANVLAGSLASEGPLMVYGLLAATGSVAVLTAVAARPQARAVAGACRTCPPEPSRPGLCVCG